MPTSPTAKAMTASLAGVILRDLLALRRQLLAYPEEQAIWLLPPGLPNIAGTLTLHLAGNLRHFIGAVLGKTGYVRERELEFSRRDVPRAELLAEVDRTVSEIGPVLESLDPATLGQPFPVRFTDVRVDTGDFLVHLSAHLAYHIGQVDYHRRLVTGDPTPAGAMTIAELRSARPSGEMKTL